MARQADIAPKWHFPDDMLADLKELVSRTGSLQEEACGWLVDERFSLSYGKDGPEYSFRLTASGEVLKALYFRCVYMDAQQKRPRRWLGVVAVTGPSIPKLTIIGWPDQRYKKVGKYRPWYGQAEGFAGEAWEIKKTTDGPVRKSRGRSVSEDSDDNSTLDEGNGSIRRGSTTSIPQNLEDEVESVISISRDEASIPRPAPVIDNQDVSASITTNFLDDQGRIMRKRPWSECRSSKRLFIQATIATILRPRDDNAALRVRIGDKEAMLLKGDDEDFEALSEAIAEVISVKREWSGDQTLEIDVYALEES